MGAFLLTNKTGGYFLSGINSRYRGFFFRDNERMFKIIDEIKSNGPIKKLTNNFYNVEAKRSTFNETYFMPHNYNSLVYELDKERKIEVFLDCRGAYDNSEWEKHYEINEEKNKVVVKFTKKQNNAEQFTFYLVIDKLCNQLLFFSNLLNLNLIM